MIIRKKTFLFTSVTNLNRDFNNHGSTDENRKDFPPTDDPVYILGKKYSSLHGKF